MTQNNEQEMPGRVVVGVDSSENSMRAARWAAREAQSRRVPLTIVHALHLLTGAALTLEPPEFAEHARDEGRKLLLLVADNVRAEFPELEVDIELSDLSAAHTLSALSLESALVVTGTRGHGGFAGMLLGSVSGKLAAHAHSPLVVVRDGQPADVLNEVVLGIDADQPDAAIRYAFAAAQRYGGVLHAVRTWLPDAASLYAMEPSLVGYAQTRAEECRAVEHLLAPLRPSFPDVKVEISAVRGNPVPVLIEAARGTRLLVVGAHRHRSPLAVGAGYTVDGLLAHSPTPVAVVPIH